MASKSKENVTNYFSFQSFANCSLFSFWISRKVRITALFTKDLIDNLEKELEEGEQGQEDERLFGFPKDVPEVRFLGS